MFGFKSKSEERREIARLEAVKESFMREHTALCEKYHAQLVPFIEVISSNLVRTSLQIDSYWPAKKDEAKPEEK